MGTTPPPREVARGCSSSTLGATPAHVIQAASVSRLSKSPKCPTHQDTYKAREAVAMQTLPSYESLESTDTSKHRAQHPKPILASQLAKQYIARKDGSMEEAEEQVRDQLQTADASAGDEMQGLTELLEKAYEGTRYEGRPEMTADATQQVHASVPEVPADPTAKQVHASVPEVPADPTAKQVQTSVPELTADPGQKQVQTSVPEVTADPGQKQVQTSVPEVTADPGQKQVQTSVEQVTADPDQKQVPASVQQVTADPDQKQVAASVQQVTADPTKQVPASVPQGMSDMPMMPPEVKAWFASMAQGNTSTTAPVEHMAGFMRALSQQSLSSNASSAPGTPSTTISKEETPDSTVFDEALKSIAKQQTEADEQCFKLHYSFMLVSCYTF
eukprot:s3766_g2.t1